MLIQITNHCTMGCPHCMQESSENGHHMSEEMFRKALEFGSWGGAIMYNISGGEPTEHPDFERFMDILRHHLDVYAVTDKIPFFAVESNGEWVRSVPKTAIVKKLLKSNRLEVFQVSSFKGLYRNYDFIQKYKRKIEALSQKVAVVTSGIISMQDLGRARTSTNANVQRAINENKHHVSCLNGCLLGKQIDDVRQFSLTLFQHAQNCKPFIDWRGNVHVSESIGCPSYGNVLTDDFESIWQNIRKAVPCGKCRLYKNLLDSGEPKIVAARRVMGIGRNSGYSNNSSYR